MPIYRLNTKRLTVLRLSGFELYSRWVPLIDVSLLQIHLLTVPLKKVHKKRTKSGQFLLNFRDALKRLKSYRI